MINREMKIIITETYKTDLDLKIKTEKGNFHVMKLNKS